MNRKKKTLFVLALLLIVGLTSGYVASTYAKYVSEVKDNTGTATVAKWKFTTDNPKQTLTINLEGTPDASTLVGGTIAPGTKGSFNVALKNGTTQTGVNFTIKLNDDKTGEISNIPTNLKFYKDAARENELQPGTGTVTGQLAANDATGVNVPIYWEWKYGDNDAVDNTTNVADTADGDAAKTLTIGVDITGVQTEPGAKITSHINGS